MAVLRRAGLPPPHLLYQDEEIIALDKPAMRELSQAALVIAKAEGLDAHTQAVERRLKAK